MKKDVRCCNCSSGLNVLEFAFFVFRIHHAFLSKCLTWIAKMQKILWIFVYEKKFLLWRTKVSEAVCKQDWCNMKSFIFLHVKISDENSVQRPLDLSLPSENIQKLVEFSDGTVTPFYLLLTGSLCLTFLIQLKCLCDVLLIKSWWHAPRPPTPVNRCLCKLHRRLFARPFKAFHSIDSGSRCWFDVALWPSVSMVI